MTTNAGRCPACGLPLNEPLPSHRRWRCPEIVRRGDVRDAAQAMGLPRDAALWLILDTMAKRTEAEVRARLAEEVKAKRYDPERGMGQRGWNAALRAVLALIQTEGAKA